MPCRDGRGVHAVADTGDNAADNEMRQGVSTGLQRSPDHHDDRAGENCLTATEVVSNPDAEDCAEETAQVVGSDGDS